MSCIVRLSLEIELMFLYDILALSLEHYKFLQFELCSCDTLYKRFLLYNNLKNFKAFLQKLF